MSVPRPMATRRPIWQLVLAIIGWLAAVASLIGYLLQPSSGDYRLLTTVLWAALGVGWLVQWRVAVKKHSQGLGQPSRPKES